MNPGDHSIIVIRNIEHGNSMCLSVAANPNIPIEDRRQVVRAIAELKRMHHIAKATDALRSIATSTKEPILKGEALAALERP